MRVRLVAIECGKAGEPISEAILEDLKHPERGLMRWWSEPESGGWETLDRDIMLSEILQKPGFEECRADLPLPTSPRGTAGGDLVADSLCD